MHITLNGVSFITSEFTPNEPILVNRIEEGPTRVAVTLSSVNAHVPAEQERLSWVEEFLIRKGYKIPAIKSVRERLGCGLKDAKDLVDRANIPYQPDFRVEDAERARNAAYRALLKILDEVLPALPFCLEQTTAIIERHCGLSLRDLREAAAVRVS